MGSQFSPGSMNFTLLSIRSHIQATHMGTHNWDHHVYGRQPQNSIFRICFFCLTHSRKYKFVKWNSEFLLAKTGQMWPLRLIVPPAIVQLHHQHTNVGRFLLQMLPLLSVSIIIFYSGGGAVTFAITPLQAFKCTKTTMQNDFHNKWYFSYLQ